MEKNKGFAFYQNFWDSIENLTIDQQKEICYAIVKYGITGEMVNVTDCPLGFSMATAFRPAIDNSVERFNNNSLNGTKGGRPTKIDSVELKNFLQENPNVTAKVAAQHFGVTESAIQKRDEWKTRKNPVKTEEWNF